MIRYLDVCSGYSAFTLANAGLGFECAGYSEIEPFPRAILEQRHGAVPVDWDHRHQPGSNITPLFGDFTKIEAHHVGPVQLLAGGTPCQAFSIAGKRLGLDDPRGNLTLEFLALARRLGVEWLLWENVKGFLSHDGGRTMGAFLGFLAECGYGFAWRVLDAQFIRVDGYERAVPQRRERLILVGHLGDAAGPASVLFDRESLRGNPAPRRETGKGIAASVAPSLVSSGRGRGIERTGETRGQDPVIAVGFGGGNSREIETATCITTKNQRLDFDSDTFVMQAGITRENPASGPDGMGAQTDAAYCLEARAETQIVAHPTAATLTRGAESSGKGGYAGRRQEDDVNLVAHAFDARQSEVIQYGNIAGPLDTDGYSIGVAHSLRAEGFDGSEDGSGRGTPIVPICIHADAITRDGGAVNPSIDATGKSRLRDAGMGISEGASFGLTTGNPHAVAFVQNSRDEVRIFGDDGQTIGALASEPGMKQQSYVAEPIAFSVRGRDGEPQAEPSEIGLSPSLRTGGGGSSHAFVAQHWAVRRLTPTEYERLMGVPDGFTQVTYRKKSAADGPRYKALGNSQCVNMMRWISHGLADVIAIQGRT